jgi:large subunit ribosomal protein L6
MSRVGKRPVAIPSGVTVQVGEAHVQVKGPKGELSTAILDGTEVKVENGEAKVLAERLTRNPAFGTMRALIQNMVTGVTAGFSKVLEIVGTGYRAQLEGKNLVLQLGFSHPIVFEPPPGITIKVESPTRVVISGADKAQVGQVAADIRAFRPPEPYKGKGVRYEGEHVRRKAGKAAGAAT